ncbi:MAG: alpha/beta hydrolase [Stomatobaculum sp.]|nr:alpha/beta hydrolase [Stomatobaculum sp.]
MSFFTLSDGQQLYYEEHGSGDRTVVFLHGWTSSHRIYADPVRRLSKHVRCIVYDHRGHGGSKDAGGDSVNMVLLADDLREILTGLRIENPILCGWSMGAGVIMEYLKKYGDEGLEQIVLVDMTPKEVNEDGWVLGLHRGKYTRADAEAEKEKPFDDVFRTFAIATFPLLAKLPRRLMERTLRRTLKQCDGEVLKQLAASMKEQDCRDAFRSLHVPLTYFYPDPGSLFPPELVIWYREHIPTRFRTARFKGCTHMLIAEQPAKFTEEMFRVIRY